MVESRLASEIRKTLSAGDRLFIIQTINALPPTQFDELCFALDPPKGVVPPNSASQGVKSKALLEWAEGPTGPGLIAVDTVLQGFISKTIQSERATKPKAFAVSGKMGDLSPAELEAIVQLLRQKTGDASIELAFFTGGSIKLVLNGSSEGLEKLQELFNSHQLTEVLYGRPVEYVHSIESDTTEGRKARLLQVLRFYIKRNNPKLIQALDPALDRVRTQILDIVQDQAIDINRDLNRNLNTYRVQNPDIDQAIDLIQNLDADRVQNLDMDEAVDLIHNLDRAIDCIRNLDLVRNLNLIQDLVRVLDIALVMVRGLVQDLEIVQDLDIDLRHADLSGANLSSLDLRGINLEGADLTNANVTGAIFGENPGLTEADKRDLKRHGAIFQEPPSSDVPSLVLR